MIGFHCFGSSSKGNSYLLDFEGRTLLIDAGLSCKQIVDGITEAGFDPARLSGVLITHDHQDHVAALPQLLKKFPELPVFANQLTIDKLCRALELSVDSFCEFENGQQFEIGDFSVESFKTSHDAADSVGYFVSAFDGKVTYFHATDLGLTDATIGRYFAAAELATLESNHDLVMLKTSARQRMLIDRISGNSGHLSNDQAADFVKSYGPSAQSLRRLQLAHLSHDCNTPEFARKTMSAALAEIGRRDVELKILE